MAVRVADPWGQSSFENMTKQAGKVVQKAASDTVRTIVSDIKEQTGIETNTGQSQQNMPNSQSKADDLANKDLEKQKNLNETRGNLARMNQEIAQLRAKRKQEEQQKQNMEKKDKQEKKAEEREKNRVPFWKQFMRKGSHEGLKKMGA